MNSFNAFSNAASVAALAAKLDKAGGTMTGALAVTLGTLATAGLRLAQTWNSAGTTCRGMEVAITATPSGFASDSTLLRVCGGSAGVTQAFAIDAVTGSATIGLSNNSAALTLQGLDRSAALRLSAFGNELTTGNLHLGSANVMLRFTDTSTSVRYGTIYGQAANVLALRDGSGGATGAAWEMLEMTAPSAPAADRVRLYVEDNGAGKTRLMALFASGAAQQIAIQP